MEFIQNTTKGSQLEALNAVATKDADSVRAAVAYVTDIQSLLEACAKHQKPLTLYARYDYTGPISHEVLQWFRKHETESANFQIRVIADIFHPKVIWWHGVGAYIGSANLTKAAWGRNIEAGVFLTEEELDENEMRSDLEAFFDQAQSLSHHVTKEIAEDLFNARSGPLAVAEHAAETAFNKTRQIPPQAGLISHTKQSAITKAREKFLREWADTLQHLRNLGQRLVQPENVPPWMPPDASSGVLVDQFLHAYYYEKVRDGVTRAAHRDFFQRNRTNPDAAVREAIDWWRHLPGPPGREDVHAAVWAPEARRLLTRESLQVMTEADFQTLCGRIHALMDHARHVATTVLGLQQGLQRMAAEERVRKFASWLFHQKSQDGSTTCHVIDHVLHGGPKADIANRLFFACYDDPKKIRHLGVSTLGEMVGWAMPDDFPPRNGRTSKALTALGYNVTIHSE